MGIVGGSGGEVVDSRKNSPTRWQIACTYQTCKSVILQILWARVWVRVCVALSYIPLHIPPPPPPPSWGVCVVEIIIRTLVQRGAFSSYGPCSANT